MEKIKKIIIPVIVVIVLLAVAAGLYYLKGSSISKEEASKIAINVINNEILQGQGVATLKEITSENGVYMIKIDLQGQEFSSYITKNGKMVFPYGVAATSQEEESAQATKDIPKTEKSQAMLFVMSFCPYGNQAEEAMAPVVSLLGDKADVQLHYVIYSNYNGGGSTYCLDSENKYCSMHGIQELNQDVRELCVQKYQPDKLWNFVLSVNNTCGSGNVDTCWEALAKTAGIDTAKIKTCQKEEAISLLEEEVILNEKYGIQGSPQLLINEKEFGGARSAEGYKAGVCAGFKTEPTECSQSLGTDVGTANGSCE
jgi:glutaredoxin